MSFEQSALGIWEGKDCEMDTLISYIEKKSLFGDYVVNLYVWGGAKTLSDHLNQKTALEKEWWAKRIRPLGYQQELLKEIWQIAYVGNSYNDFEHHYSIFLKYITDMRDLINNEGLPESDELLSLGGLASRFQNNIIEAVNRDLKFLRRTPIKVEEGELDWDRYLERFRRTLEDCGESDQKRYFKAMFRRSKKPRVLEAMLDICKSFFRYLRAAVDRNEGVEYNDIIIIKVYQNTYSILHYLPFDSIDAFIKDTETVTPRNLQYFLEKPRVDPPVVNEALLNACFFAGIFPNEFTYPLVDSNLEEMESALDKLYGCINGTISFQDFQLCPVNKTLLEDFYLTPVKGETAGLTGTMQSLSEETPTSRRPALKMEKYTDIAMGSFLPMIAIGAGALVLGLYFFK
jgi:hypothetical protein